MRLELLPRGTERVLVVQEWESVRRLCRRVLEALGYRVAEAGSAEEARVAVCGIPGGPDLAIVGVALTRTSGFELSSQLAGFSRDLRTLFTSAYPWGEEPGGRRFLETPFTMAELALKVRQVLDEVPKCRG